MSTINEYRNNESIKRDKKSKEKRFFNNHTLIYIKGVSYTFFYEATTDD